MSERTDRIAFDLLTPLWTWLLSDEAQGLPAHTVAEIVATARVLYIALGGKVRDRP